MLMTEMHLTTHNMTCLILVYISLRLPPLYLKTCNSSSLNLVSDQRHLSQFTCQIYPINYMYIHIRNYYNIHIQCTTISADSPPVCLEICNSIQHLESCTRSLMHLLITINPLDLLHLQLYKLAMCV